MKWFKYAVFIFTILLFCFIAGGCFILSVHPLYFEENLVFKPELIGTWGNSEDINPEGEAWIFEKDDDKAYRLTFREDDGQIGYFEAHLVKLGDYLFLDLFPEEPETGNEIFNFHLIPAHSFFRVYSIGETLDMAMLDPEWVRDNLEAKKIKIKHEERDDVLVLTASTRELQAFVLKYAGDAFVLEEGDELYRWE